MTRKPLFTLIGLTVVIGGVYLSGLLFRDHDSTRHDPPSPSTQSKQISPASTLQAPSPPEGFPSLPETAREFRVLTSEESAALESMIRDFWATQDENTRMDLLDQMEAMLYGRELAVLVEDLFKSHPTASDDLLEQALGILSGNISTSILPALEAALAHPEESIRESAVLSAGQIRHTAMIAFLSAATNDDSPSVRASVFETLENQTATTRSEVLSRALQSKFEDTAVNAIGELEFAATHPTVPRLIEALASPWETVREDARQTFELWFGETFDSPGAAMAWWEKNHDRYDQDLVEK